MQKGLSKGFTLVELLIVIALLGVIATIVIAAINPIEQAARARDASYKADASQLISAIQRYYVSHNEYPWNVCAGVGCTPQVTGTDTEVDFVSADTAGYGLCTVTGKSCKTQTLQGELVTSLELQTAFLNKTWIGATLGSVDHTTALVIGKAGSASSSVYACWAPASTTNRQNLINLGKVVNVSQPFPTGQDTPAAGTCTAATDAGWKTGACQECVPE